MTDAYTRALRAIEALINAAPSKRRKPAKRKKVALIKRRRSYNPPRAPVDEAKLAEQQAVFAPPPTPPEAPGPIMHALWLPPVEHRADGCTVYRGCVILPDGELLDDVLESEAQRRTEGSAA